MISLRCRFGFSLCLLFLSSVGWCADLPAPAPDDTRRSAGPVAARDAPAPAAETPSGEAPRDGDSAAPPMDPVYAFLVGQVAGQRDEHRVALTHLLQGAQAARDPRLAALAAGTALVLGDVAALRRTTDLWLALAPDAVGAHRLAAYARLEAGEVSAAVGHLGRVIALAARAGEDGYSQVAHLVAGLKPPERRLRLMETLTAELPESSDAWFARALVAAGADRYEAAVAAAQRASELRPGWNPPRLLQVRMLLKRQDRKQARQVLEAFVAESPENQELHLLYAQLLVDEQAFSRAREVYERILRGAPREPDVLFALGILSLELEDAQGARDYFTRLHETGKHRHTSAFYLGRVEEQADNPEAAISWYRSVGGEHATDAQIRIALMRAEQGKVERAREILQRLRDRWPEKAPMFYLIEASTLSELDRPRAAMAVYDEALAAFPGDHELRYARGLHALSLDRLDIMEQDFRAILAEDPDNADTLNALGYSLAEHTERFTEALGYIERALALKPDDPAILDSMGWVQFRLGNSEQALEYLRRALAPMPNGEIAAHLGEVLWTLGRHEEARSTWKTALDQEPDHEYLLRVIGRYQSAPAAPRAP
ncbi:MAG: tetratricopeptide repeat protein [Candidatus Thiosymbion ectosymbiont of Robbea hypermnestra]|nr:tetratricopeptide repeat protein [Candidatus Thiosymbion ectosymbiont of Robbea hypermnestra]